MLKRTEEMHKHVQTNKVMGERVDSQYVHIFELNTLFKRFDLGPL